MHYASSKPKNTNKGELVHDDSNQNTIQDQEERKPEYKYTNQVKIKTLQNVFVKTGTNTFGRCIIKCLNSILGHGLKVMHFPSGGDICKCCPFNCDGTRSTAG